MTGGLPPVRPRTGVVVSPICASFTDEIAFKFSDGAKMVMIYRPPDVAVSSLETKYVVPQR